MPSSLAPQLLQGAAVHLRHGRAILRQPTDRLHKGGHITAAPVLPRHGHCRAQKLGPKRGRPNGRSPGRKLKIPWKISENLGKMRKMMKRYEK